MRWAFPVATALILLAAPAGAQQGEAVRVHAAVREVLRHELIDRPMVEFPTREVAHRENICSSAGKCRYPDDAIRVVIAPPRFSTPDTAIVVVYQYFNGKRLSDTVSMGGPTNYLFARSAGQWSFVGRRPYETPSPPADRYPKYPASECPIPSRCEPG